MVRLAKTDGRSLPLVAVLFALALCSSAAHAADNVWTNGNGTGVWNDTGNWSLGALPTTADRAVFDATSDTNCDVDTNVDIGGILIDTGYNSTVTVTLAFTFRVRTQHFTMNSGNFVGGSGLLTIGGLNVPAELNILGGSFTASSTITEIPWIFRVEGLGTFNDNGGKINALVAGSGFANALWEFETDVTVNDLEIIKGSHNIDHRNTFNGFTGHLIITGTLTLTSMGIWNDGTVEIQGDVTGVASGIASSVTFIINGPGNQQIGGTNPGDFIALGGHHTVDKTTGTLTYVNGIVITRNFTVLNEGAGIVTAGSNFRFTSNGNVNSVITTNNATTGFEFENVQIVKTSHSAAFADDAVINGDLDIQSVFQISDTATPPGHNVQVFGSLTIADGGVVNAITLELVGTNNQAIDVVTGSATPGDLPDGDLVINKTGGIAFLTADLAPPSPAGTPSLIVREGTLFCDGFDVSMTGTITVEDGGNLQLRGNETIAPAPTLDSGSLVTYVGNGNSLADTFVIQNWVPYQSIAIDSTDAADVFALPANLSVSENLTLSGGILDATASNFDINITGDWAQSGTGVFDPRNGDVEFLGDFTSSDVTGSTTFFDFTCTAQGKNLSFEAGTTQDITGQLTLTGTSGNLIFLASSSPGTQWRLRTQDDEFTRLASFVNVTDGVNLGIPMIFTNPPNDSSNSVDGGNNINWFSDITPVNLTLDSATPTHPNGNTWDIQVTTADGFVPYSYLWTTATGGVTFGTGTAEDTTVDLTGAPADTVITVTVTVTDFAGFTDSIDVQLIRTSTALDVVAGASPSVGSEGTGNAWNITSTASGGVPVPGEMPSDDYTYLWTGPGGVVFGDPNAANTTVDLTGAAADTDLVLTITVTDLFSNSDFDTVTVYRSSTGLLATASVVYVTPPAPDPFSPDVIVVTGTASAFTLTGTPTNFAAVSELWNDLTTPNPAFSTLNPVTVNAPGTAGTYIYEYRGTDLHGLIGIATVTVFVVDPVNAVATATPPVLDLTLNLSTTLNAIGSTGGAPDAGFGGYIYEWRDLDTNTVLGTTVSVVYAPTGLGVHTVQLTVTDEIGNTDTTIIAIPLIESALLVVATGTENFGGTTVSGNNLIGFAGGTLVLSSDGFGGVGTYEFAWTGPNGFTSTQQNPGAVVLPFVPGTYVYTVFLTDPLLPQTVSDTVTIQVFESISNQGLFIGNGKCKYKATTASTSDKGKDSAKIRLEGVAFSPGDRLAFDFNGRPIGDIASGSSIVLDNNFKGTGQLGPIFGPNFFPKVTVKYKASRIRLDAKCTKGNFEPFGSADPLASAVTGLSPIVNVTVFVDRAPADNIVDDTIVLPLMFKVRAKLNSQNVFTESGKKVAP